VVDYPFLTKHFSEPEIAASMKKDARGMVSATLHGMTVLGEESGQAQRVDEDGLQIEPDDDESDPYYLFTLWGDSVLEGNPWLQGVQDLMVPANPTGYGPANGKAYPGWGGTLARYLYPRVIDKAKKVNPQVKGSEAWGWLPPPLMEEGKKVQTDWLHDFLMDPTKIRPAAIMRMPNFHMSTDDAAKLVDYFAAVSGAEFPYEYKSRQRASYLAKLEVEQPKRLADAIEIADSPAELQSIVSGRSGIDLSDGERVKHEKRKRRLVLRISFTDEDQYQIIYSAIRSVMLECGVNEGRALELICADFLSGTGSIRDGAVQLLAEVHNEEVHNEVV